jgi:glycosyltransferase involved in cell wall biosynthesis
MKTTQKNPTALIFHRNLLPKSETFVLAQADNLRRFHPYFAGVQHTGGLELPQDRMCSMAGRGWYGDAAARWFKLTGYSPRFLDRLRNIGAAVVHAHFEESGLAALPVARDLDIPLITTFHGYDATAIPSTSGTRRILNHVYDRQRRNLQREGRRFVAVSEFIRKKLLARGYPADRTITLPIGVDIDLFTPRKEQPAQPMVLFVGRLVEKKGVTYLLDAMAEVARQRRDVRLVLIGTGPLMPQLVDQACALKLPNVIFMGTCDSSTVRQQMNIASLLVSPSVTAASGDSEGLPIVVCEAQAIGLPVVGTRHAGIPEIVHHEETGFLVPERSVGELAQRISSLLADPERRGRMGAAARANVSLNFNLQIQTAKLEDLYAEVVLEHMKLRAAQ